MSQTVSISWKDKSNNETGFEIERCQGQTCSGFVKIDTVPANTTTYVDTGLLDNTYYRYRVRAINSKGKSGYTNVLTVLTGGGPVPPLSPPVITSITPGDTTALLNWTPVVGTSITYGVQRSTNLA